MRCSKLIVVAVLALMAGAASARNLQQAGFKPAKLDLPPIQDFFPKPEQMQGYSLNEWLVKSGLPKWEELGLPPISELMKPVAPPGSAMAKLPSRAEVAKMANETLVQVVTELLPPELKALSNVKLPKFRMAQVLPQMKLPQMPEKLPPLEDLLKALPPMDPKAAMSIPGLNVKLPPAGDVMKFMKQAGNVLNNIPKPANMPSLQEVMAVVNSVSSSVNKVVATPGGMA